jgi:hypothetical protein
MTAAPPPVTTALPALPAGWHVVRFEVLHGARLAVIGADGDVRAAWLSDVEGKTVGETARLAKSGTAKVWTVDDGALVEQLAFPLFDPFPMVEQFRDGRWLVSTARSAGHGNARILGVDGVEQRCIEIGDGINHVQIDDQDGIWVGWGDEGVFGNTHWRLPGHKWPPSAFGIAAFDEHGVLLDHATLPSIADCYALNVFGTEAWSCTYTDFPIWQMLNGHQRTWNTDLSGVSAIAVSFPYVLAAGGYEPDSDRVVLLKLHERAASTEGEWRISAPPRRAVGLVAARGDELHVVREGHWLRWRVADFVQLCG